jgi:uncharacterized protein YukE
MQGEYSFSIQMVDLATGAVKKVAGDAKTLTAEIDKLGKRNAALRTEFDALGATAVKTQEKLKRALSIKDAISPTDVRNVERLNKVINTYSNELEKADRAQRKLFQTTRQAPIGGVSAGTGRSGGTGFFTRMGGGELAYGAADVMSGGLSPYMLPHMLRSPYFLGGVALAGTLGYAASRSLSFDDAMGKVNMTARLNVGERDALGQFIKKVATDEGQNATEAALAFERVISTTGDTKRAQEMFRPVLQGAKAMRTDEYTVAKAVAAVGNVDRTKTASEIVDMLVTAQKLGAGEGVDFATYLPNLITSGQGVGMSSESVTAAFSQLTKTMSADKASTLIDNMMTSLGRTEVTSKMSPALGGMYNPDNSLKDISQIASQLQAKIKGMNDHELPIFLENIGLRDVQARQGWLNLARDAEELKTQLDGVKNSAGEAAAAIAAGESATKNLQRAWERLGNAFINTKVVKGGAEGLRRMLAGVSDKLEGYNPNDVLEGKAQADERFFDYIKRNPAYLNPSETDLNNTEDRASVLWLRQNRERLYSGDPAEMARVMAEFTKLMAQEMRPTLPDYHSRLMGLEKPYSMMDGVRATDTTGRGGADAVADVITGQSEIMQGGVGGITINIQRLNGVENLRVSEKHVGERVGHEVLKTLNKAIRDAEGMRGGGTR